MGQSAPSGEFTRAVLLQHIIIRFHCYQHQTVSSMLAQIQPLHVQAECNTFPEWITLFTLCFAPLIAHIISGTAPITSVTQSRPKWLDLICHYNPTSIIWRYAAIADRRLRATKWGPNDLAAANAIFWTEKGWNGDERLVAATSSYCLLKPQTSHLDLLSTTSLKTVIVTMQGAAALYSLVGGITDSGAIDPIANMGLDVIFSPLAIIGLLRLCAATWLTEDFAYTNLGNLVHIPLRNGGMFDEDGILQFSTDDDLDPWLVAPAETRYDFTRPNSSWSSCAFRAFYLSLCVGIWSISLLSLVFPLQDPYYSLSFTSLLVSLFYLIFMTTTCLLYAMYFLQGKTTSTVFPGISTTWYKVYTLSILFSMLVLIIVAALETQRSPDGNYTSYNAFNNLRCKPKSRAGPVSANDGFLGLVSAFPPDATILEGITATTIGNATISDTAYWLYNFTGYCIGQF
jgi:hypothetical protein